MEKNENSLLANEKKSKKIKKYFRNVQGITLVALVVTIVVLLILAGVSIGVMTGENGIFNKAEQTTEQYEQSKARERLEIVMESLLISKYTDSMYNQDRYITKAITDQKMQVIGDIVLVDGYQFQIDRSVPKIVTNLGKGEENNNIAIQVTASTTDDFVKGNIEINIIYEGNIKEVIFQGESIENIEKENGVYTINKEVTENGKYTIIARDENGGYKIETATIIDLTQDMEVYDETTMKEFRSKVEEGRTFEDRTVRVTKSFSLNGTEDNQWTPIAQNEKAFKGTLDGQGYTIDGLYIDNDKAYQALFGYNNGKIKNLTLKGHMKSTKRAVAVFTIWNRGNIENCVNQCDVSGAETVGGICASNGGDIIQCKNEGAVSSNGYIVGGISAYANGGTIDECFNVAVISAKGKDALGWSQVGGICGFMEGGSVTNCYNTGSVSGSYGQVRRDYGVYLASYGSNCKY